jgi:RNA polymerase-associated protein CTR9
MLAKNMIEPAGLIFKFCLEKSSNNSPFLLPSQLGQACFQFLSGNFRSALTSFQGILKSNPHLNDIRCAIGYCFLKLDFQEMAIKAFNRVLQIEPQKEAALVALGFLQLDQDDQLQNGLIQMKQVFQLNRLNAVAQIHLANHFFFKKEFQKSKILIDGALSNAPNDKIKAEAYFISAKISHVQGNFSEALGNYQLASKLSPDFLPALFGLGQCFLARDDLDGATLMFEKILEFEPNCPEVLRLMILIHCSKLALKRSQGSNESKESKEFKESSSSALNLLPSVLKLFPHDSLIQSCAAVLYEAVDQEKSLEFYSKSNAQESQNFAILNNFVVLKQKLKKIQGPSDLELLKRAKSLNSDKNLNLYLKFNEARLLEELDSGDSDSGSSSDKDKDNVQRANEIYKEILKENPNFSLAHLRLGIISFRKGQLSEATDHFKDVLGIDESNRDAWNCLAAINLKQKALNPARKSFERVLQNIDKNDPYALVALGNIYIELARQDKSNKHTDEYHKRAGEFFCKALSVDKGNFFAAQGLGLIFADRGISSEAKEVFSQVRAAQGDQKSTIDSTLNLAHSLVEMEMYSNALTLYSSIPQTDSNTGKKVSYLLYLCRVRYLLALEGGDVSAADLAIIDARKALELLPNDEPLKFNLALLLQARATAIKNSSQVKFELFPSALENLKEAKEIFNSISFDEKLISTKISSCQTITKTIEKLSISTEKSLKEQVDRLEQLKIQREIQAQKEIEIRNQKEAAEIKRIEEIERSRKELAAKMRETEEKIKAVSNVKFVKDVDTDTDPENDSDPENHNGESSAAFKKPRKKRTKTIEDSNGDDEVDGIVQTSSRRRATSNSKFSAPLLSKEFISSSEDEPMEN